MNWLDFVIIIVILGFVVAAYSAGLIREVVTLLAAFAGVLIAGALYGRLAEDVVVFVSDDDAARAISFLLLFGAVYLFGQTLAFVLKKVASLLMLGPADHLGGAAFGLLKGLIVVQVLLILFAAYPSLKLDTAIANSEIAPYFIDDASVLLHVMPSEFGDRIDSTHTDTPATIETPTDAAADPVTGG